MFKIFLIEDIVTLNVSEYVTDRQKVLFQKLSNRFINKVINGVGLSIALEENFPKYESRILQTEGCAHYKVNFKLLVFSPSINDVFKAKVTSFNKYFIKFSIGFFSDIQTLSEFLPPNYKYDENSKCWYKSHEGGKKTIKTNDTVQFKVMDVIYNRKKDDSNNKVPSSLPVLMVIGTILN